MDDNTNTIILEDLKHIQTSLDRVEDGIKEINSMLKNIEIGQADIVAKLSMSPSSRRLEIA